MDLRLRRPAFWARLHLRSGLQGWDLPRELALDATCDQLPPGEAAPAGAHSPFPASFAGRRGARGRFRPAVPLDEPRHREGRGRDPRRPCVPAGGQPPNRLSPQLLTRPSRRRGSTRRQAARPRLLAFPSRGLVVSDEGPSGGGPRLRPRPCSKIPGIKQQGRPAAAQPG